MCLQKEIELFLKHHYFCCLCFNCKKVPLESSVASTTNKKRCALRRLLVLGAVPSSLWGSDTPGWICSFEFSQFDSQHRVDSDASLQSSTVTEWSVWSKRSSSCAQRALMKAAQFSHTDCRTQSSCGGGRQTGYWFPVKSDGAACKPRHRSVRVQKRLTRLSTQLKFVKCCCCCLCMSLRWGGGD